MDAFIKPRSFSALPSLPEEALTDLLATAYLPFHIASNPSFINFVEVVQRHPKWTVPHRYTLSTSGVDTLWRNVVQSIAQLVSTCSKVGVTTDGWTGPKALGYWALTLNGITTDFDWVNTPLSLMPIPSTHSAHHLASHILSELKTFNISRDVCQFDNR